MRVRRVYRFALRAMRTGLLCSFRTAPLGKCCMLPGNFCLPLAFCPLPLASRPLPFAPCLSPLASRPFPLLIVSEVGQNLVSQFHTDIRLCFYCAGADMRRAGYQWVAQQLFTRGRFIFKHIEASAAHRAVFQRFHHICCADTGSSGCVDQRKTGPTGFYKCRIYQVSGFIRQWQVQADDIGHL